MIPENGAVCGIPTQGSHHHPPEAAAGQRAGMKKLGLPREAQRRAASCDHEPCLKSKETENSVFAFPVEKNVKEGVFLSQNKTRPIR